MFKKIIIIVVVFCCFGCSTSSILFRKNEFYCSPNGITINLEDVQFIKNKDFSIIFKLLKTKYKAISIRNIFYIKSTNQYYAEYYINNYTIQCVILGEDFKHISKGEVQFDW